MLSIIIPTRGRPTLRDTIDSLLHQLTPTDEVLVVGDGPQPQALAMVQACPSFQVQYHETPAPTFCYGNAQRNYGIAHAKGEYVAFVDDDDVYNPDALRAMRQAIEANYGRLFMFRMDVTCYGWRHIPPVLWDEREVRQGNVGGPMFVAPRNERLGNYVDLYHADFLFIRDTVARYPPGSLLWKEDIIITCRPMTTPRPNSN